MSGRGRRCLDRFPGWCQGVAAAGLAHERRSLRLCAADITWHTEGAGTWILAFTLERGQFATAVLRECGDFENWSAMTPTPFRRGLDVEHQR